MPPSVRENEQILGLWGQALFRREIKGGTIDDRIGLGYRRSSEDGRGDGVVGIDVGLCNVAR